MRCASWRRMSTLSSGWSNVSQDRLDRTCIVYPRRVSNGTPASKSPPSFEKRAQISEAPWRTRWCSWDRPDIMTRIGHHTQSPSVHIHGTAQHKARNSGKCPLGGTNRSVFLDPEMLCSEDRSNG